MKFSIKLFVCFFYVAIAFGQNSSSVKTSAKTSAKTSVSDSTAIKLFKAHEKELNSLPTDSIKRVMHEILRLTENRTVDSITRQTQQKALLTLMNEHGRSRAYDSVRYYYTKLEEINGNKLILAHGKNKLAKLECVTSNYEKCLYYYYEALEMAKELNDKNLIDNSLLDIARYYISTKRLDLAKELLNEVQNTQNESRTAITKYRIMDASYDINMEDKAYPKALADLKSLDTTVLFNETKIAKYHYYASMYRVKQKLKDYDSALTYLKKNSSLSKEIYGHEEPFVFIYYAEHYHDVGDQAKAISYFNQIKDTTSANNQNGFLTMYFSVGSKIYESINNTDLALHYNKKHFEINEKIVEKSNTKLQAIYTYQIKKDKDINKLELEKAEQERLTADNKRKYTYTMVISFFVVTMLFLVAFFYYKRKKDIKELEYLQRKKLINLKINT